MTILQSLKYLQEVYNQKAALIKKEGTPEYNEEQYNSLMNYYNDKIEELRKRVEKQDAAALLKFDTNSANEIEVTAGIEFISNG
ncbi:hypothetical protein [Tenacibaculum ovolyticum]|uniref:hypothetical protein n=1 Tax=Tenacibaculum ovolyticum TaxID=104270 RepID=UPI0007ECC5E1|nr:hypothetical protein [Tenacibaculum ovolyticum]